MRARACPPCRSTAAPRASSGAVGAWRHSVPTGSRSTPRARPSCTTGCSFPETGSASRASSSTTTPRHRTHHARGRGSMKILVMIKQVPDTATQVKIAGDGRAIDTAGITWIVSPYDEFAVEEALRIKEKRGQGEVVAVSLGPDRVKEALRSCLAMGVDRAIHLPDPAWDGADTLATARALAAVIKQEAPGLAMFGRQAIDDDMGSVGAQVAE